MFTGIIQDVGQIRSAYDFGTDARLQIGVGTMALSDCKVGDSVAVSGVCLTVTALEPRSFSADVSHETLSLTTLGSAVAGTRVNLEAALRVGDALGGHLVSGHVDGIGVIEAISVDGRSQRVTIRVPQSLARYVARKGSIAVDGVSLTVNDVDGATFGANLVPHTQQLTTCNEWTVGRCVNIEVDQLARYVERVLGQGQA